MMGFEANDLQQDHLRLYVGSIGKSELSPRLRGFINLYRLSRYHFAIERIQLLWWHGSPFLLWRTQRITIGLTCNKTGWRICYGWGNC